MRKTTLLLIVIFQSAFISAQRFEWVSTSRQYNSNQNIPVATDSSGNVYTLIDVDPNANCIIQGDTTFAVVPGTTGTVVVKFGPAGNFIWGKRIDPDGGGISGGMIAVDNAGFIYASVNFPNAGKVHLKDTVYDPGIVSYAHILKFNSSGNFIKAKSYPNGSFIAAPYISCLGTDLYVAEANSVQKLDSSFNTVWSITDLTGSLTFSNTSSSKADIFVQKNGQLVVSAWEFGNTIGDVPFGNDTVHFHTGGLDEGAIIKLDTSGHVLWTHAFACNNNSPAIRAVCLDVYGNSYIALQGNNSQVIFGNDTLINSLGTGDFESIFKWDNAGNPVKAIGLYNYASAAVIRDLAVNAQSALLVSGMIGSSKMYIDANDSINGYGNFFLIKYDSAGIYKWYKTEANNTATFIDGIAVRNGNEYVLGGSTGSGANYQFDCIADPTTGSTNFVTVISELPRKLPIAAFTYSGNGFVYSFTNQSQNADSVSWNFGDGNFSNLLNPVHTFGTIQNYTVVLTAYYGACVSTDTIVIFNVGISEQNTSLSFSIYPNPSSGNFTLTFNENLHNASVKIFNALGEEVYASQSFSGRIFSLPKGESWGGVGIYFVRVIAGDRIYSAKLIVE